MNNLTNFSHLLSCILDCIIGVFIENGRLP